MSYPTKYTRQYDFASYQNSNPSRPLPADKVNADYNAVQNSIGEIVEFLKGFSRADKKLANKSVGRDQLADNVPLGFDTPTAWAARTLYTTTSTVFHGNVFYKANVEHTSGDSFDPTKWDVIADFSGAVAAAQASADAAAASASAASGSVTDAETAETNAEAAQTAAEAAQALAEAAAASIALIVTPQQYGAVAGESENGVTNSTAFQSAIDAVNAAGGGVVWVRNLGEPYVIGDNSTPNTCIRLKSNVVLLHDPGVIYLHKAKGRTSPDSTDAESVAWARQGCLFQLDGKEFGALNGVKILGKPLIDGLSTAPVKRGVNMYGELNDIHIQVRCQNLLDMALTWADDDVLRYGKGQNLVFEVDYLGEHPEATTQIIDIFPKGTQADGGRALRNVTFQNCDMVGTNDTTNISTDDVFNCIKMSNAENVHFGPGVRLRGGTVSCLDLINGVQRVTGSVDVGDSPIGVLISNSIQINAPGPQPTGHFDLDVHMSGKVGTTRIAAVAIQGNVPGVHVNVNSENGGVEFMESDQIHMAVSSMTGDFAYGDLVTTSGGATGKIVAWSDVRMALLRDGSLSGSFVDGHTFTTDGGGSGTIGTQDEVDGLFGAVVNGSIKYGRLGVEATSSARTPIRGCKIHLNIDGDKNDTASQCETGNSHWHMDDSEITLNFKNPPIYGLVNYGAENKIKITSDGIGTNNANSVLLRDYGKNTQFEGHIKATGRHAGLWTLESGATGFKVIGVSAPSTIAVHKAVTASQPPARGTMVLRADFDLSAAAKVQPLLRATHPILVVGVEVVYPSGTTADAGKKLQVGSIASPNVMYETTSLTSQSVGASSADGQTGTGHILGNPLASGVLIAKCEGGKTGADPVSVFVHAVEVRTPA